VLEARIIPLPAREVSPSMLLAAPFAVVPWHSAGRAEIMATLDAWADDTTQPVAVRLLHAPGGAGKTRLAMEWLQRRRDRGDTAGFLPVAAKDDWLARTCGLGVPVVVAIDYAETRADLLAVLGDIAAMAAAPKPPRVHVLLLARSDGDWWDALLERELALKALLTAQAPVALRPLAMEAVERQEVFDEALAAFAKYRGRPVPRAQIAADDPRFDRVLYLHMAALAAVERAAEPVGTVGAETAVVLDAGELMDATLDHEQLFWLRDRQARNQAKLSLARQVVAAATLRGGISHEAKAQELCKRLSGRERTEADDELLALLHDVYALNEGGPYLPGLQPDLLGEAMVLRVATKQADDRWIERVIVEGDDAEAVGNAFTVLGRAAAVDAAATSPWITTLLRTELTTRALLAMRAAMVVGLQTAFSPLGNLLADALEYERKSVVALALANEPISLSTVSLRRVAEWQSRMELADVPAGNEPENIELRAARWSNWGIRLMYLGQRERALAAIQQATEHYRALTANNPDAFAGSFAGSLINLSSQLSALGQREPARAAIQEAVDRYRALAVQHPDVFAPFLAASLINLGTMLSALGQRERALAATQEAVDHYRTLAETKPDSFVPLLASSLNNMGNKWGALGQHKAALAVTQEAVAHYRALVAVTPDAFTPEFVTSLGTLGTKLSALGQRERALAATQEAVDHCRALAVTNPDAFAPSLANSLSNLGTMLSALGQHERALAVTQEAVDHYRTLAAKTPDAFLPLLARGLTNLGVARNAFGQREAALAVIREAVEQGRVLVSIDPDAFAPDLALSLKNLGAILSVLGQYEAALADTQEAVNHYRALAAKTPDAFVPDLASSLNNLGAILGALGHRETALAATQEAVDHCRALAGTNPDVFTPNLASSLKNLGAMLGTLGLREAALAATQEAVTHYQALAAKYPDAFLPDLATSLHNLGLHLTEIGDNDAADAASYEAAEIRRTLQAKTPGPDDEGGSA
jgi:tetratricopeptide (TPR) repeat protein